MLRNDPHGNNQFMAFCVIFGVMVLLLAEVYCYFYGGK